MYVGGMGRMWDREGSEEGEQTGSCEWEVLWKRKVVGRKGRKKVCKKWNEVRKWVRSEIKWVRSEKV